jgi:hypothetical protein
LKISDLNEKCNLLEQSLRVIAQENHDLEQIKKTNMQRKTFHSVTNSPVKNATSANNSDDEDDHFYDIGM